LLGFTTLHDTRRYANAHWPTNSDSQPLMPTAAASALAGRGENQTRCGNLEGRNELHGSHHRAKRSLSLTRRAEEPLVAGGLVHAKAVLVA
jgi:hypothetical protein